MMLANPPPLVCHSGLRDLSVSPDTSKVGVPPRALSLLFKNLWPTPDAQATGQEIGRLVRE